MLATAFFPIASMFSTLSKTEIMLTNKFFRVVMTQENTVAGKNKIKVK